VSRELGSYQGAIIFCEGQIPDVTSDKVSFVSISERLTFKTVLSWVKDQAQLNDSAIVLTNSDIYLTDDVFELTKFLHVNDLIALTRYESLEKNHPFRLDNPYPGQPSDSQDTWIFRSDCNLKDLRTMAADIPLGIPGCENAFCAEVVRLGFDVFNPCLNVMTIHNHDSDVRSYVEKDRIPKPYGFPLACCKEEFFLRSKKRLPIIRS
jgi:hypothetical protein